MTRSQADKIAEVTPAARKQLTVLFCDIADYTSRSTTLDPEDLADEIQVFRQICTQVAERYQGHIANFQGDGIMVLFGHPRADEFDPDRAVRAGLEIISAVQKNNHTNHWKNRNPIVLRVGIATGLVVVGSTQEEKEQVFGEAPTLAARLQSIAQPNTVVTALRTRRLIGGAFETRDLGMHQLKGFKHPVNIWQVLRPTNLQKRSSTALKRVTTPFISRQRELGKLSEYYQHAIHGFSRIMHLQGEPGIGKTRLIRVFEKSIHKQNLYRVRISCSPYYRDSPLKPVAEGSYRWLQLSEDDDLATKHATVRFAMNNLGLENRPEHALFMEMLGIPLEDGLKSPDVGAEVKRRLTIKATADITIGMARIYPMFLVVEDIHWADPSTLDLLTEIINRSQQEQLFAILTSRPSFMPPWEESHNFSELELGRLNQHEAGQLVDSIFDRGMLPEPIRDTLVTKSDGVPLFLEESSWNILHQIRKQGMPKIWKISLKFRKRFRTPSMRDLISWVAPKRWPSWPRHLAANSPTRALSPLPISMVLRQISAWTFCWTPMF